MQDNKSHSSVVLGPLGQWSCPLLFSFVDAKTKCTNTLIYLRNTWGFKMDRMPKYSAGSKYQMAL